MVVKVLWGQGRIKGTNRNTVMVHPGTELEPWALFWADGNRCLDGIAEILSCEYKREVALEQVVAFFEAHAKLGYVELIEPKDTIAKS